MREDKSKQSLVLISAAERGGRAKWIKRVGTRQFRYFNAKGERITLQNELERIKALSIPPAWTNVRICPSTRGKLQAIGIDAAGRIQYRYSEKFSNAQKELKFARVIEFGRALPSLRRQLNSDINLEGFSKSKILAVMIRLINDLYIRVGSEKSVQLYKTYGITTLRNRHLQIKPNGELHFDFVGKHHIRHRRVVVDKEMALVMNDLKAIGGGKLFNYQDENNSTCPVKPRDINEYIKKATNGEFSAKDFRTWGATVLAAQELAEIGAAENKTQTNKNIVRMIKVVAEHLGNTPAVCRSSYVHPIVIACYEKGITIREFVPRTKRQISKFQPEHLPEEIGLLELLANQNC